MAKDNIYQHHQSPVAPFEFDEQVADVFDDMINRSIPLYNEIIHRQAQIISRYYQPGTTIYDLGCSNGNLSLQVGRQMAGTPFNLVAVDSSAPMLDAFQKRLAAAPEGNHVDLQCKDICQTDIENASVVVLNFTMQFLPPSERNALTSKIYAGMSPGGIFLFSEKITHNNDILAELQDEFYYTFKRENGYSDIEISQKREALEKVLVPETMAQHMVRLRKAGFQTIDIWQKWFNFVAMIAVK